MKIVKLQSENIKRLRAIEIVPKGPVVTIGGKNAAGKTSVLDSIEYALGGQPAATQPVRQGEEFGRVVVDLGDLVVKRTFGVRGSTLVVTNAEGVKQLSPQGILDKLVGRLAFDPLAFARQKPADQAETLRGLVALDVSDLEKDRANIYTQRTTANADAARLKAQIAAIPPMDDVSGDEISTAAIMEQANEAARICRANDERRRSTDGFAARLKALKMEFDGVKATIMQMVAQLKVLEKQRDDLSRTYSEQVSLVDRMVKETSALKDPDLQRFKGMAQEAELQNQKIRLKRRRIELVKELMAAADKAEALTRALDVNDATKRRRVAEAKFPVPGLAFEAGHVTLNRIPFDQCSSAEQLKVSVAIGMALNPKLRVLLIRDGSLLDEDSMKILAETAAANDTQVWIEVVRTDSSVSVVIEDGAVKPHHD